MDIHLPNFVISSLFADNLVLIQHEESNAPKDSAKDRQINISENIPDSNPEKYWLGDNIKHITILLEDENNVFTSDAHLAFLTSILSACHLSLADVAIVNFAKTNITFEKIQQQLTCTRLLVFGIPDTMRRLSTSQELYTETIINGCSILFSAPLEILIRPDARPEKGKLWSGLKKLFQI